MAFPLQKLPNDILYQMAYAHLDQKTLASLSAVNHDFHDLLTPILYRREAKQHHSQALIWAAANGSLNTARLCLKYGADINTFGGPYAEHDQTKISQFAQRNVEQFVEWMVAPDEETCPTPKFWTEAETPSAAMRKLWKPQDQDDREINFAESTREFYGTPLHWAARKGHTRVLQWLLKKGADPNRWSKDMCSCKHSVHVSSWEYDDGSDPEPMNLGPLLISMRSWPWRALHVALCYGHQDAAMVLLEHGADSREAMCPVAVPHMDGSSDRHLWYSPMSTIATSGSERVLKYLMSNIARFPHLRSDMNRRSDLTHQTPPLLDILQCYPRDSRSNTTPELKRMAQLMLQLGSSPVLRNADIRRVFVQGFRNPAAVMALMDSGIDFFSHNMHSMEKLLRCFVQTREQLPWRNEDEYGLHYDAWIRLRAMVVRQLLGRCSKMGADGARSEQGTLFVGGKRVPVMVVVLAARVTFRTWSPELREELEGLECFVFKNIKEAMGRGIRVAGDGRMAKRRSVGRR